MSKKTVSLEVKVDEAMKNADRDQVYSHENINWEDEKLWSPVAKMFSALKKVVPEKDLNTLEGIAAFDTQAMWKIGDIVNSIYTRAQAGKRTSEYQFNDVCYFVAQACLKGTRSYSTVKGYALTCRRFTPKSRQELHFHDIPFSHFAYAGQAKFEVLCDDGLPKWHEILEHSYQKSLEAGRQISERELRVKFENKSPEIKQSFKLGSSPSMDDYIGTARMNSNETETLPSVGYVSEKLSIISSELKNLAVFINGNFPNIGAGTLAQAILLIDNFLSRIQA